MHAERVSPNPARPPARPPARRRAILSCEDLDFDGLLKMAIGLSGKMDLLALLALAEVLAGYAGEAGREVTAGLP